MKKDAYYFSHDYNAADDVKCLFLRQQLGMEGYGIFWYLVEKLANSGGVLPLNITPVLAMQMQCPEIKVKAVIEQFDLFIITENSFQSNRLNLHLSERKTISDGGRKGAEIRWGNRNNTPPIALPNSGGNDLPNKGGNAKESKRKESKRKENKVNTIPTIEDFLSFCKSEYDSLNQNFLEYEYSVKAKYESWVENGWKDGNNAPIKNWKSKFKNVIQYIKPMKVNIQHFQSNSLQGDSDFEIFKQRSAELNKTI